MKKVNMFFDIEKEEKWLNEQLQEGYHCKNISGFGVYSFQETTERYVMRLDYQDYLTKKKFQEYKAIYEDFGWVHIAGWRSGGIQYWQKQRGGQSEIFSDRQSKSNYYKRLMSYSFWFLMLSLYFCYLMYKDSGLYLTQGLWDMEGALFWKALIFETPFVLLRSFPIFMVILFGISFYKAYRKYSVFKDS